MRKKPLSQTPKAIRTRELYAANPERGKAKTKRWQTKNPLKVKNILSAWRADSVEYCKEYAHAYYINNPISEEKRQLRNEGFREAYRANPLPQIRQATLWQKEHPQEHGKSVKKWAGLNPDIRRTISQRRRAKQYSAVVDNFTAVELEAHIEALGSCCVYCGAPWEHLDHVYPIAKGGTHGLSNLVPACALCNWRKGSKLPIQWLTSLPGFGRLCVVDP